MFGNLFNSRKTVRSEDEATGETQVTGAEVKIEQNSGGDLFGDATKVSESIKVAAPNVPSEPSEQSNKSIVANPQSRENITALSRLDPRATQVLNQAQQLAKKNGQQLIEPMHLLYGLIYDGEIFKVLEQFGVDGAKVSQEIEGRQEKGNFFGQPTLSDGSKEILEEAYGTAKQRVASFISPEDILLAVFQATQTADLLKSKGIDKAGVEEKLSKSTGYVLAHKSMIEKYSIDLTVEAHEGRLDPVAGRDREIERLIHILLRRTKNNPIIIGEAGVGKTAIVEGLAELMISGKISADLASKKIIQLDLSALVAGASHRGEFEERLQNVIKEVLASSGQIILFIDEIHNIIGAGETEGSLDASNILKPYLGRGTLQIIGTTTIAEYRKKFEKDRAFERRFQPVTVEEPTEEIALEMLKVLQPKYESFHKVQFAQEALQSAVHLSKRYIGERYLPYKAIDLIDEAGAQVRLEVASQKKSNSQVTEQDIEQVVSSWTGIPITKLTEKESEKLLKLEELIHQKFINHDRAVKAVSEAVRRGRIGLSNVNRPIASFIFLGPTGVGKTELAKRLAEIMFGKEDLMIRLDMSEYMEKHEVAKLVGAPPGYVGYEEGGQLTEAVRTKPYSIVL